VKDSQLDLAQKADSRMKPAQYVRISNVSFQNFKAFRQYSISLEQVNILVGPNNSGKSTVIGALRALDSGLKIARTRPSQRLYFDGTSEIGYRIPKDSLPIALENVHTNYNSELSIVTFTLSNRNKLHLTFPVEGGCVLVPEVSGRVVGTAAAFKLHFPISLMVVPVLGPVENNEARRERATIVDGLSTHRASRHFRNYWHYFPDGFAEFAQLVKSTWPGMEVEPPEFNMSSGELTMFCREDRVTRELYWVGFGFQIWCQLLTHLSRSKGSSLVVMDEPETYLHPDVQRQLLGVVRDVGADVMLATHSSEIIAESDPSEIVLIDKWKRAGDRLRDVVGVQKALDAIGSSQNITLTALARSRRVLFVEGDDDFRLLRRFARRIGLQELSVGAGVIALPSGGFGSWQRVTTLASGIAEALGASLSIAAIYDRDYFCPEQICEVFAKLSGHLRLAHVHKRKEIENYLLIPVVLDRALRRAVDERVARRGIQYPDIPSIAQLLQNITEPLRGDTLSQMMAKRANYLRV
jgi:energy-coupling factor transporter ATP-binding protein EcfA2